MFLRDRPSVRALALLAALAAPLAPVAAQDCTDSGLNPGPPPPPTFAPVTDADNLQVMIDSGLLWPSLYVVAVEPGTYEPITIFADLFPNGLLIYSTQGPLDATGAPLTTIERASGTLGPVIDVVGSVSTSGQIAIGWAEDADPAAWRGFHVTGGYVADQASGGGGLRAILHTGELAVRGCVIEANQAVQSGGGVYLRDCADALLAVSEVRGNRAAVDLDYFPAPVRGAGIYQLRGAFALLGCAVHDNVFGEDLIGWTPEPTRQGGGVAAALVAGSDFTACSNEVWANDACEGGGLWIEIVAHGGPSFAHVERNRVHDNAPWTPPGGTFGLDLDGAYRGGGVFVRASSMDAKGFTGSYSVRLWIDRVRGNATRNPGFGTPPGVTDDVGGGLYADAAIRAGIDELGLEGDALWLNDAPAAGGGAYLDTSGTGAARIWLCTLSHNSLDVGGLGGGLYLTSTSAFDGSTNVVFENVVPGAAGTNPNDWYAEPGVTDVMRYTQLPAYTNAGADVSAGVADSAASPSFGLPNDPHIDEASPCIDSGEPGLAPSIAVDIDDRPRLIDWIGAPGFTHDRGAVEFVAFKRGNANADFSLDIADANFILAYLFQGGAMSVCPDAMDVNDDGTIDITDAVLLLNYLFPPPGSPPVVVPEPFTVCGDDPTPDALGVGIGTPWF